MPDGYRAPTLRLWERDLPWIEPHQAAAAFADLPALVLLDSTGPVTAEARHAVLCIDPYRVIGGDDPLGELAGLLGQVELPPDPGGMPFRGGAAGFIGFEVGVGLQGVPVVAAGMAEPPDMFIGLYDLVIGFDRAARRCCVYASGLPCGDAAGQQQRAQARIAWVEQRLAGASAPMPAAALPTLRFEPGWTRAEYQDRVQRVLAYIAAGDVFQANLTMAHVAPRPAGLSGWQVHAALRRANPAPFGAWLRCGAFDLCCSSPERFIRLDTGALLETRPIKGTAARDRDPAIDAAAAAALAASGKDRAENVMIVDVLRHDLGRVAAIGSIEVPELCGLHSFATVHHLVSTIRGRLRPGLGAVDVLRAALPGGSISGAPKIRALQIIAEIEGRRRGPYCGSVVAIGFDGAMDSNIVIRSLVLSPEQIVAQAGGGIVADSDPGGEWEEMMLKSAPMRGLFGGA